MKKLKTYLRQRVQCIFNRVHEQFDESESKVSYLIIHFDRVICILLRASSSLYTPTELESLLPRAREITVAVSVD